jgi:amino acid adenylation domain-containing protein/thioester reductase-like protein
MKLFPLSKPQKSIWNMEQYYGGSIANITGSAIFEEKVDICALGIALNKVVEQCDSLRIRIKTHIGIAMQYIDPYMPCEFEILNFDTKEKFSEWIEALAKKPFDLQGNLYKFYIISVNRKVGFALHMHHLTADAWTLHLIINNIVKNLENRTVISHSYFNYLIEEQEYDNSSRHKMDKDYFFNKFELCPNPVYFNEKSSRTVLSKRMSFIIDKNDTESIQNFCLENDISPYSLFMNALALYISRIRGAKDIYIGTSVLNRTGKKEKNTAGMYINTVPVLFQIDEAKSVHVNIINNNDSIMGLFRHQKYHYSELLSDIRDKYNYIDRLYDVTLSYQNAVLPDCLTAEWHFCGCQGESLNIHINDRYNKGVLHIDYDYQLEILNELSIKRLHKNLMNLIFEIISKSYQKPQELKMLSDDEYLKVIFEFNDTAIDYPKDKCIHQLFEEQAAQKPDEVAIIFEDTKYTYSQINNMSNSLASLLRKKGIGRNDIVAIIAERDYKIIVAQLAIMKAGGAYLPIDPNFPKDRIGFMLDDAKCKLALVIGKEITSVDNIDMGDENVYSGSISDIENINSSGDLCYVIYTSGSTGTPKGVMVSHRNFVNFCSKNKYNVQCSILVKRSVILCMGAFVFDMASAEIFLALLNGHILVLTNNTQIEQPEELARLISTYDVAFILSVPTRIISYMSSKAFRKSMKKWKVLSFGGEKLTQDMVNTFKNCTDAIVLNTYGPAETTMGCSWTSIDGDTTIGKPIANTQLYILDKNSCPLPIGSVGELCISGDGVGLGYLNRPKLTNEKFIENPFVSGKRMYKSGDLARWREDGNIEYIGRMDNQVKIRGLRIELGEIETAIAAFSGITQSVVVDKKGVSGNQYICAYYVSDKDIDEKAMRAELSKKLPRYMIPHFFIRLSAFPTTASGKVDRNAFPSPDFLNIQIETKYVAPVTDNEKAITALFQSVLDIQRVGVDDNFFDLGGDSLKAIEFVSKAQDEGISFTLQDVFNYPTSALLLKHIADGNQRSVVYNAEDFTEVHHLLQKNKDNEGVAPIAHSLGNILLTGATGWLGAHILDEFLSCELGTAYCLVRGGNLHDSEKRLNDTLRYYFGEKYTDNDRIAVFCGDVTQRITLDKPINTIIHCAANVKHYGSYQFSHAVNVDGTKNVIELAKDKGVMLIHVSTTSVSGNGFEKTHDLQPTVFDETKLFVGQSLENIYVRSKLESEMAVFKAKLEGLDAVVMRVGNLSNRRADLKFQKNHFENATLKRLKAFVDLGLFPIEMADLPIEFSPVDDTAKAIIVLAQHFDDSAVFHVYNPKPISFSDFVKALQVVGMEMMPVPMDGFMHAIHETRNIPGREHIHEAFIDDVDANGKVNFHSNITLENHNTVNFLEKAGFSWKDVDDSYLHEYVRYFRNINFWSDLNEK